MYKKRHDAVSFLKDTGAIARVEISSIHGSTPRDQDAWMLVSDHTIFKTIGGGQLEKIAIEKARELLDGDSTTPTQMQIPLGPHIGQCCGGTVHLSIQKLDQDTLNILIQKAQDEISQLPSIYIFGAGHVGIALAETLSLLPVNPILIDSRKTELNAVPKHIETQLSALPETYVRSAPLGSAIIILTHDHALDFLIAQETLLRDDFAYIGMIGSKTKRATFKNWYRRENGLGRDAEQAIEKLTCPIGNHMISDKRPEVIAALTASEIIVKLDQFNMTTKSNHNMVHAAGGN
jgi:xanthine dehydrogenase accessory factor